MKLFHWWKKITGLALGGGAVLGAVHVGVLKALEEHETRLDCIAGTSAGAFIAALYAFGKSPEEIRDIISDLRWLNISNISLSRYGLMSNMKLGDLLVKHLGDKKVEDAEIPLSIVATDITNGEKVVLQKGKLAVAVRASTCIPGIYTPVETDGRMLVDGGIVENVPLSPLKKAGANYIIGVELLTHDKQRKPDNIIEVLLNTFEFMVNNVTKSQEKEFNILLRPDLSAYDKIHIQQVDELVTIGYEAAMKQLTRAI